MLCVPIYNSMLLSQGTYFVLAVSYLCCPCIQLLKYNAKFSYKKKKKKKKNVENFIVVASAFNKQKDLHRTICRLM